MKLFLTLDEVSEQYRLKVGGKGYALSVLARNNFNVPLTLCLTTEAYRQYVSATGLRERILLELNRKDFNDMRWEEIWDASLRIRNMFLTTDVPKHLRLNIRNSLAAYFDDKPVVVRSSSVGEDSAQASFAGLHESFVNVRGVDSILDHVRLVWASLWSDAALLYRQEIGLDVGKSLMGVIVQEIVEGDRSGVIFSTDPNNPSQLVIEAVHGLNQGLVDGLVEPDRWQIDRAGKRIVSHTPAQRESLVVSIDVGTRLESLPSELRDRAPLSDDEVIEICDLALMSEDLFGVPQDVEWTIRGGHLMVLQSRPITMIGEAQKEDKKRWYLSLRRSYENLQSLRKRIEEELIPGMERDVRQMAAQDLSLLSDRELVSEIRRRKGISDRWTTIYWEEYIPFAHGVRLFGQFYNDTVRPEDPYEFVRLLGATEMESVERNRLLESMAAILRERDDLRDRLIHGRYLEVGDKFLNLLDQFIVKFGDLSCPTTGVVQCNQTPEGLIRIVLEMASHPPTPGAFATEDLASLIDKYSHRFEGERQLLAMDLLDLARTSYRLRDDDNIKLARIDAQRIMALNEGKRRIENHDGRLPDAELVGEVAVGSYDPEVISPVPLPLEEVRAGYRIKPRQLRGQPAGPGVAKGSARVVMGSSDLLEFKHGEVLVCDAVDPNMTFVVPLASGIVERRGGMLIHGAIIAREYGIPCVTGVTDATKLIRSGDLITLDGFLGIVTIGSPKLP